jgi:pimeloyl-ACP methyl ester carboxylesterase
VLVQTGDGDVVVDPHNSELLAEAIPGARLSVFEGAGHLFMWQQPERFVAELEEFLC